MPVAHLVIGEIISSYEKLVQYPITKEEWTTSLGKEFPNLAQSNNKTDTQGLDETIIMDHNQLLNIPDDIIVTYVRIIVDFFAQKI